MWGLRALAFRGLGIRGVVFISLSFLRNPQTEPSTLKKLVEPDRSLKVYLFGGLRGVGFRGLGFRVSNLGLALFSLAHY